MLTDDEAIKSIEDSIESAALGLDLQQALLLPQSSCMYMDLHIVESFL